MSNLLSNSKLDRGSDRRLGRRPIGLSRGRPTSDRFWLASGLEIFSPVGGSEVDGGDGRGEVLNRVVIDTSVRLGNVLGRVLIDTGDGLGAAGSNATR